MFQPLILAALLAATVGYRTSYAGATDEPELPDTLLAPEGTVAVQDVHPLLTLANLRLAAPQLEETGFLQWLDTARVTAATKVLTDWQTQKQLTGTGKRLLQDQPLTNYSGQYRDKIIRQGRFVGLAVRMRADQPDVSVRVTAVGTQFTQPEPGFKLYVFHSSDLTAPVQELPLPRLDRVYFEWSNLATPLVLSSKKGGTWYIGYYEDDMQGQAIRLDQNLQQRPGQCCGNAYMQYDQWSPYVQVLPFAYLAAPDEPLYSTLFSYYSDTNWGLNLQLEASCDLTNALTRQLPAFEVALRLQLAVDLLQVLAYSTRDNSSAYKTDALALLELNNRSNGQPGLLTQLETAKSALQVDLSGISKTCLPCAPKPGAVKFKTI
ncbi:hypothetical protein SAMN06265337_0639 [Hymenobacter gelipurpurascens]|uniref:Uncharacterized protein n=1 Tax=Hymenobacter gelipurpurascens TaxID=89968 RepID=A0A212T8W5_9BACT|nr:hypothetical protein [Hymenobacter gelipurpurascens]SNC62281.1 hypothetical protein SAMN06265337_0639 [Hymenobacter gelipurpurascens]